MQLRPEIENFLGVVSDLNQERIRSMTDEQLIEALCRTWLDASVCVGKAAALFHAATDKRKPEIQGG
jgi:hypothetical protein